MAEATNSFETGLASGTVITGANSGDGNAGTAFGSNWYMAAGTTPTFDSTHKAHGTLSGKLTLTASNGGSMGFNPGAVPAIWTRGYFRHQSVPGGNAILLSVRDGAVTASGFYVRLQSSGLLQVLDRVAFAGVATTPVSVDTWYRLETYFNINGDWEYWLYAADATAPLATDSGTVPNTAATKFDFCRWGFEGTSLTNAVHLDDLAYSDTAKLGPLLEPLNTPTGFTFTAHVSLPQVTATWSPVAGADHYQLEVQEWDGAAFQPFTTVDPATSPVSLGTGQGVTDGTTYRARVRAMPAV